MHESRKFSLGGKIFSLALIMLILLISIACFSYIRLNHVKKEIVDLTESVIPITDAVTLMDIHVLEQEIHLERILRLFEISPLNPQDIIREYKLFKQRGELVNKEIDKAIAIVM